MKLTTEQKQEIEDFAFDNFRLNSAFFNSVDFKQEMNRIWSNRHAVRKFLEKSDNEKIILNNLIVMLNVFDAQATNIICRMIFDDMEFGVVKSVLLFLGSYTLWDDTTKPNQIMSDILFDTRIRMLKG